MTIDLFAAQNHVKRDKVLEWISKGLIPGAHDDYIPEHARRPYTRARAKNGQGIIKSILTACDNKYGICASLYHISEAEFCSYINGLLDAGHIDKFEEDGIVYYNISASGVELLKNWNKKDVIAIVQTLVAIAGVVVPVLSAV